MELLFLLLFCAIIWILFMVFFGAMMGKMFQIGKKIDEQVGIEGFGMVSLIVIVFFIIPFVVTGLLWNSGFFKNAFEVEDQGEGLFLVLLPFWVAIGLIVLITTAIILWQRVREKRERGGEREKWQAEAELSESLERQSEEIREMAEREKKKWQTQLSELQERQTEPSIPPPIENTVEPAPVSRQTVFTAPVPTYTGLGSDEMATIDKIDSEPSGKWEMVPCEECIMCSIGLSCTTKKRVWVPDK